jgi:hypothetical protein
MYFCPSRRGPVQEQGGRWLMDYGALVPVPARWQLPGLAGANFFKVTNGITNSCQGSSLWTEIGDFLDQKQALTDAQRANVRNQYWGVIVRGPYFREGTTEWKTGFTPPVKFARITDGTSNTAVVTEKRIDPNTYDTGSGPPDDRGWSDGWDYDTMRLAVCVPYPDSGSVREFTNTPGAAHTGVFNTGFADGSVHALSYDIEVEMFNNLAHRSDGNVVEVDGL